MEEDTSSIIDIVVVFFARYNASEIVFFYIILQILLLSQFKINNVFDMHHLESDYRGLTEHVFYKPLFLSLFILIFLFFSFVYILMLSFCFHGLLTLIPDIWFLIFSEKIKTPNFNLNLAARDGSIFLVISWFYCYAVNRNKEVKSQLDLIKKMQNEEWLKTVVSR